MNIKAILYSDVYRPMAFCLFSVFLVYCVRNDRIKKQIIAYSVFLIYIIALFTGFMFLVTLANESFDIRDWFWGIKRICFLLVIIVIQHFVYKIFGKGKDLGLVLLNTVVVLTLCYIVMRCFL